MAGLGTLTIDLAANISRFEKALTRAEQQAQKRSSGIQRTFKRLAGGIGAALITSGFIKATEASLEFADSIGKAADRAGIATDKLQEYRFAADQFGISTQQMDDGLRRFTRRLGVALDDGSFAKDFEALGVSIRDAAGNVRESGDVLDDVVIQMGKLESQAQKSKVAAQLFGDDTGPQLALLLGQGSAAVTALTSKARDLGLVMSEDLIRNAEKANDEMSILSQVLKIEMTSAVVALAPQIKDLASFLIQATSGVAAFFASIDNLNADQVEDKINQLSSSISVARAKVAEAQKRESSSGLQDTILNSLLPSSEDLQLRVDSLETDLDDAWMRLGELNAQALDRSTRNSDIIPGVLGLTAGELETELDLAVAQFEKLDEEHRKSAEKRKKIEQDLSNVTNNMKMAVFQNAVNLVRALFPESKKAAQAIIIVEKGLGIAQTIINTEVAATAAAAWAAKLGGPGAAAAAYAQIKALGAASVGLIAATGLAQVAAVNSGGVSGGVGAGGVAQTPSEAALDPFAQAEALSSGSVVININGGLINEEFLYDDLLPAITGAVEDRDYILIRNDTRNAEEFKA